MTETQDKTAVTSALAVLLVALAAVSHGSIFVRLADAHPFVVSAFRVGTAAAIVVPLALALRWREFRLLDRKALGYSLAAGTFLALHFATWIASLNHTSIANSTVLVTLNPVWIALATALITRKRPGRMVVFSIGLSLTGCMVIAWGSSSGKGATSLFGDGLALLGGICAAGYLMLGRLARGRGISLLSYIALCYGSAAVLLWALVLGMGLPVIGFDPVTYQAMIAMGVISQVIGHSGYNWGLKLFNPGFIALCLLGEPILASVLGLIYFGEAIPPATVAAAPLILSGIYLGARVELK